MKRNSGFTIIEALVAVTLVGVLSGITVSIINAPRKRLEAEDAVKLNTLHDLVSALETARLSEGRYPIGDSRVAIEPIINTYIESWPNDYLYLGLPDAFYLSVSKSSDTNECYLYYNDSANPYGSEEIRSCEVFMGICWINCTSL